MPLHESERDAFGVCLPLYGRSICRILINAVLVVHFAYHTFSNSAMSACYNFIKYTDHNK